MNTASVFSFMFTVLITFLSTRHYYLKQIKFVTSKVVSAQHLAESSQNTNDGMEVKLQSLELELQERRNKQIGFIEQLEQAQQSLKSCTGGQAKLESDAAVCNQQMLEKRHQLEAKVKQLEDKEKEVERLEVTLKDSEGRMEKEIGQLSSSTNTCKAELEAEQTNFKSVQNKLSEAEKQQLNINKTYESEVSKLTKTFEGQVSQQKNRIQEIGKDRKDKVIKLAVQLTNLRGQLDELVDHIESQHQEINEVHHFDD